MFVPPLAKGGSAIVAELSGAPALKIHAVCHAAALGLLALAIVLDNPAVARVGSAAGLAGALAFAWFAGDIIRRIQSAILLGA